MRVRDMEVRAKRRTVQTGRQTETLRDREVRAKRWTGRQRQERHGG